MNIDNVIIIKKNVMIHFLNIPSFFFSIQLIKMPKRAKKLQGKQQGQGGLERICRRLPKSNK